MNTTLQILKRWPHVHAAFLAGTAAMAFTPDTPAWILATVGIGCAWVAVVRHQARMLALLLCGLLLLPAGAAEPKPEQQGGATACGVAVGVVVVIVGGVVVVKIIRFCQRKFSAPASGSATNADPHGVWEGSSCIGTKQSCARLADVAGPATHVRLSGRADGGLTLTRVPEMDLLEESDWEDGLRRLGFPTVWGSKSSVVDGAAVEPETSRIWIHDGAISVQGDDVRPVVIERSTNLYDWEPSITLWIPAGMGFEVDDSSEQDGSYWRRL